MLHNKTNKSVFSVLCITAMIALSLTACKKNDEKQNAIEQQPVVQQNNEKNNKQSENNQAISQNQKKAENEYPVKDIKSMFKYQNEAKQIVLMLDYCLKNRSPEICENIADIYNGDIVNGKIKIVNNTKEKINQQFNLDIDEEFKIYEKRVKYNEKIQEKIEEIEKKQKEGLISKNEESNLKKMVIKNEKKQNPFKGKIGRYVESNAYRMFLEEIEKRLESKKNDAMEASRKNWNNAPAKWEEYNEMIESLDAEDKIKETIFELYFLACSNSNNNWEYQRSNHKLAGDSAWGDIYSNGSTTACHKAVSSLNSVAFLTKGSTRRDELGIRKGFRAKIKYSDYLDIYSGICRNKKISNACILAGDTLFNKGLINENHIIDYNRLVLAFHNYYNLTDEKTPEVEEKAAFIQQLDRYFQKNGVCSAYSEHHHLDSLAELTRNATEPKEKMNLIWNIIKSDTCITKDENNNLFLEDITKIQQKQQQKQQEKEEFLKSIDAPIN